MDIKHALTKMIGAAALAGTALAANAATTVVNLDDLQGWGAVANGYAGMNWDGWYHYDAEQNPYTPASGSQRIYDGVPGSFSFLAPVVFDGAYVAGPSPDYGYNLSPVSFSLYYQGQLVHTSNPLVESATPTFLSSGYTGLVDSVRVNGTTDFFVLDDITYSTAAVPEPQNLALMLAGLALVAGAARRRARKD